MKSLFTYYPFTKQDPFIDGFESQDVAEQAESPVVSTKLCQDHGGPDLLVKII